MLLDRRTRTPCQPHAQGRRRPPPVPAPLQAPPRRAAAPAGRCRRRRIVSGMPPTLLATTALPAAIASSIAIGKPSACEGRQNTAARASCSSRSFWPTQPGSSMRSAMPSSAALLRSASASPSPPNTRRSAGNFAARRRAGRQQLEHALGRLQPAEEQDAAAAPAAPRTAPAAAPNSAIPSPLPSARTRARKPAQPFDSVITTELASSVWRIQRRIRAPASTVANWRKPPPCK
jgi:hypothetical protein